MPVIKPVRVDFGEDANKELDKYVHDNLIAVKESFETLHTEKVPKWRRLYKGIPTEAQRNFPWPNASNVVVQLIGENVDIIKAIIIGSIYEIMPLWVAGLVGDWKVEEEAEEQRSSVERFLDLMGLSSDELDLYRVESLAANDIAQFGTVVIKSPWETCTEQLVIVDNGSSKANGSGAIGGGIGPKKMPTSDDIIIYDGPRPEKLAMEDWGATPTAPTWQKAKFKYHHYILHKDDIQERIQDGRIEEKAGEELLKSPDREGKDNVTQEKLQSQNIQASSLKALAEWDIYECWLTYWHNEKRFKIIYIYHLATSKKLNAIFDFYPKNDEPFELGRLGYTDDGIIGYGYSEMLEMYQEECSTGHNQRVDNRTLGNTSVIFAGNNPRIDAGFSAYPMAVFPFNKDEADIRQLGIAYPSSVEEESLTISLAKARAGTNIPDVTGSGSGTTSKKGIYSSMGTFAVLQQGTRRVNVNITDFRYMHLKLGQRFLKQYAEFGIGERSKYLGENAKYLKMALQNIKRGRIELPIRAATASINKEIEKQNGMLFTQVMQRHYSTIAQILQGILNPTMPPELKEYLVGSISGQAYIMSKLLRAFGYDDIYRMQPELELVKKLRSGENGQQNVSRTQGANGNETRSEPAFPETNEGEGANTPPPQATGMENTGGIPVV